jgi:putative intracellular protease/amidase
MGLNTQSPEDLKRWRPWPVVGDLTKDANSIALLEAFQQQGTPMALVCHAPCVLLNIKLPNGEPLIKGKNVTGFSDAEEAAVKLTNVVPLLNSIFLSSS